MKFKPRLPAYVSWIPGKIGDWELWKPTIRCAVVAWVCWVLLLIVPVERALGQASFFIVVIAIIVPPSDPLAMFLDKMVGIFLFVGLGWAWATIGYVIAIAVRSNVQPLEALARENDRYPGLEASNPEIFLQTAIFDGVYLETKSSAVMATFLGVGVTIMIYLRSKLVPAFGQPTSSIMACILMDVVLTYGALIPSFDAVLGSVFVIPMLVYTAVAIVGALVIFPETVQEQYCKRYIAVLSGMKTILEDQPKMLATPPSSEKWKDWVTLKEQREGLGTAYQSLDVSGSNLNREISWGRFSHDDLKDLQDGLRKLIVRIGGMAYFHRTVSEWLERKTAAEESRANSRHSSRANSRASSPAPDDSHDHLNGTSTPDLDHDTPRESDSHLNLRQLDTHDSMGDLLTPSVSITINDSGTSTPRQTRKRKDKHHHHWFHYPSEDSPRIHAPRPVGVFESMRYITVHNRFLVDGDSQNVDNMLALLAAASEPLLKDCAETVEAIRVFFQAVDKDKWWKFRQRKGRAARIKEDLRKKLDLKERLQSSIESFKTTGRVSALDPYRHMPLTGSTPYRGLFFVSIYCFHLIDFAQALLTLLEEVAEAEKKSTVSKIWWPVMSWGRLFGAGSRSDGNELDDEDPDTIRGLEEFIGGEPVAARDPDSEGPSNLFQYYGGKLQRSTSGLFRKGDAFFAAKAGLITVIVAMPQYVQATSRFFYYNRGLWVIIMAQLTLQRWAGDTFLQWFYRVIATFFGAAFGCAFWYIGSGSGDGNPYGLGAIAAVALPLIYFVRLHSPYLVFYILFSVTIFLVMGYSRQDGVGGFTLVNPGVGWDVAWRRFLLVTIGISIAAIFALIPPETSRHSVRRTLSKSIAEMGSVHAELLSYAGRPHAGPDAMIVDNLVRINAKLRGYLTLRISGAEYEPTLEGAWPAEKYRMLQSTLLELSDLLGQLMTVYWRIGQTHLDKRWREGLVLRTRFLQPTFIGETMAVYYILTSALKTGAALPQILPTPLVDRAFDKRYGLRIPHGSDPDAKKSSDGTETPVPPSPATPGMRGRGDHPLAERHVRLEEPSPVPALDRYTLDKQDLTFEMLSDEGYMIFVTGVLTTYDMLTRLDRLVMVVRELVGERYPIRGLGRAALLGEDAA